MNDLRVLRDRQIAAETALDRLGAAADPYGDAAMLVVTTTVETYPGSPNEFYACNPQLCYGDETEGGTPTFTTDTDTVIYGLGIGSAVPASGTQLVLHSVGGRWCFRYDG
jgi:hypothetical protein